MSKQKKCHYCQRTAEYECHYQFCKKPLCEKHRLFDSECKECKEKREAKTPGYELKWHQLPTISVSDLPVTITFSPKKAKDIKNV